MIDLRRADHAARRAAEILGKRAMPAPYPHDPAKQAVEASGRRRQAEYDAVLINARDGALRLLRDAVELEQNAQRAQAAAVEALRHLGGASVSWADIGGILGISAQGAHKRLRSVEGPLPQITIDQLAVELQEATTA